MDAQIREGFGQLHPTTPPSESTETLIRQAWDVPGLGLPGGVQAQPGFFRYLPPVYVSYWERVWNTPYVPALAPAIQQLPARTPPGEQTGSGYVLVITNVQWFATTAAGVLLGPVELVGFVRFFLMANGSPLFDVGTNRSAAGFPGTVATELGTGSLFPNQSQQAAPGFSVYVRPDTVLEAQYQTDIAPIAAPATVGVRLQGWKIPITDFQRALSREGAGQLF